ncbi:MULTISPECIES: hypothetical protein [unclassified Paraburkholderia]|uniref:hypothetical protein n=1 Tax=unclassified Paraburkholderia TaxID=2615204 RepID=UPI001609EA07|nr:MULTISPECIES: hypothetical protein [unclassified Paraburkholderia]MBB5447068.1 hypothetical protein [Paraburkholderia sp. WSM4177]MBB5487609.1 hypothetical protein [Paraburkholderia sp. WSM4180]
MEIRRAKPWQRRRAPIERKKKLLANEAKRQNKFYLGIAYFYNFPYNNGEQQAICRASPNGPRWRRHNEL